MPTGVGSATTRIMHASLILRLERGETRFDEIMLGNYERLTEVPELTVGTRPGRLRER